MFLIFYVRYHKCFWYFMLESTFILIFSLILQDLVPNAHMTGFPQTLEPKSKEKRGGRYLQLQAVLLSTQEGILLGKDKHHEVKMLFIVFLLSFISALFLLSSWSVKSLDHLWTKYLKICLITILILDLWFSSSAFSIWYDW